MQPSYQDNELEKFVANCKARLKILLERLEWSEECVLKNFNTNSLGSAPTAPKTAKQPSAVKTPTYPESCITQNSIVLKTPKLQSLLNDGSVEAPQNFNELQANFTRDQKLKIYEHTIENTYKLDNNTVDEVAEGEVSLADIVAEKRREAKRKKRKFRKTKPTRLEEVRALVQLQMQALQQFIQNQGGTDASIHHENETFIKVEPEASEVGFDTRTGNSNFNQRTHTEDSYRNYKNQQRNYSRSKNSYKYTEEQSYAHKKNVERTNDCERRESIRSRSPGHSRYVDQSSKKYNEYREHEKYGGKQNKSTTSNKYEHYKSHKKHARHENSTKGYERRRSKSPQSSNNYRKRYDKYDQSTKEYERRRNRSPESNNNNYEEQCRKRHEKPTKEYERRRSRSPHCSKYHMNKNRNKDYYSKERYQSGRHNERGDGRGSKNREYGECPDIVKYECKIENYSE